MNQAALLRSLLLSSSALLWAGVCQAQTSGQGGAQGSAANPDSTTSAVSEIIVTAERRSESIQNVPASVVAVGQRSIQQMGLTNTQDITRITPGIATTTSNSLSTATNLSIRGIASFVGTATTALYIDDTPIQVRYLGQGEASGNAYPVLFDLDRVEVLRGPQGTLFGASAEGGAVRFITAAPSLTDFSGHARAEVSDNATGGLGYQFGIAEGGPIQTGQLGFRVSAYLQQDAGWVDLRPYPGNTVIDKNSNSQLTGAASLALEWQPTSNVTITPSFFWQRQHSDNASFYWGTEDASNPGADKFNSGELFTAPTTDEFELYSLKAQWDAGPATLFSNTSYLNHTLSSTRDYSFGLTETFTGNFDGGPVVPSPSYFQNPQREFTQEIRLQSSESDARLKWVVGAFYNDVQQQALQTIFSPQLDTLTEAVFGAPVAAVFGVPIAPNGLVYYALDTSEDSQVAGFGQADLRVVDNLTLTAGVRVARSTYRFTNNIAGALNSGTGASGGNEAETDVLPKFALNYKPNSDLLFYLSAGKGFRPGGGNTPLPVLCDGALKALGYNGTPESYQSDSLWSYEVGSKGQALGNHLVWDASAFYVDWSKIQQSVYLPACGNQFIANLGSAVSKGFDLQLSASPAPGLTLGGAVGYTDAHYAQTVDSPNGPIVTKGDQLQTPPWHVEVSLDYVTEPLAPDTRAYFHADDEYASGYTLGNAADLLFDPLAARYSSNNFLTLRAGVRVRRWDVSVFAKNVLDEHPNLGINHTTPTSQLLLENTFAPRIVGMTATTNF